MPFPWEKDHTSLRCDAFMQKALFHPQHGYYARRIRTVGRSGDFSTSPTLSTSPAEAIANWARPQLKKFHTKHLIELGPGDGTLALQLLQKLPRKVRLHLVETSSPLRKLQQDKLKKYAHRFFPRVIWHQDIVLALTACQGNACLYSNEFFDAFPLRRFRYDGSEQWSESYIQAPGIESWKKIEKEDLPKSSVFLTPWNEGQVVEVHESIQNWLVQLSAHWKSGAMLTIDYGAELPDLYHRRPHGSLRGYWNHHMVSGEEVFKNAGHQDLTADINFTDFCSWSGQFAKQEPLITQTEFLQNHSHKRSPNDSFLTNPLGAGTAFLVHQMSKVPFSH